PQVANGSEPGSGAQREIESGCAAAGTGETCCHGTQRTGRVSMKAWRNISLRRRLVLLTMVSSSVGLMFALLMYLAYNEHLAREHKVEELQSAADLIGTNSAAAL